MLAKGKLRKISIISIFVVAVFLIVGFVFYSFFIREDFMVFKVSNITNLYEKVKKAEKDTGNLELSEEDINAIIQNYAKKLNGYKKVEILGVYSNLKESKLNIYIPIKYGIIKTTIFSSGAVKFEDDKVIYTPNAFKLGKIGLKKDFMLSKLRGLSSKEITIGSNEIFISKEVLPFDVMELNLLDNELIVKIQKLALNSPAAGANEISPRNPTDKKVSTAEEQDILKRASKQLNGVKNAVNSDEAKNIASKMQDVVNKMIDTPDYSYRNESNDLKLQYSQLPSGEKDNIKEAILNNMDSATMRQVKSTFGF